MTPRSSYSMGGALGVSVFHARERGRFVPPPPLLFLSCLVAFDRAVGIPAHRSKIETEGQSRHGTRGKTNTHEGRSNQASRNRHGIQSHLVSHHRRKSLLVRFLSTPTIIHEQAPNLYIQTPTPQTEHNRRRSQTHQATSPPRRRHPADTARRPHDDTRGQTSKERAATLPAYACRKTGRQDEQRGMGNETRARRGQGR